MINLKCPGNEVVGSFCHLALCPGELCRKCRVKHFFFINRWRLYPKNCNTMAYWRDGFVGGLVFAAVLMIPAVCIMVRF